MNIDQLIKTTRALIEVPYCCPELKKAAEAWLGSIGSDSERAAARAYVEELREDVCTIDDAIAFFSSPKAAEHFGKQEAAAKLTEVIKKKAQGEKYCGCEACSLGAQVLENSELLLK